MPNLTEDGEGNWRKDKMFVSTGNIEQALGLEVKEKIVVGD